MTALSSEERQLREKIESGPQKPDDYTALASLLYTLGRFDESLSVLRHAVQQPLPDLSRASLLTSLGWYVNNITHDLKEVVSLGEQAAALTQGTERVEALTERAFAQSLVAQGAQIMDPVRAATTATSALSLFAQVMGASPKLDAEALHDIHLQAACLECLLGHTEEARLFYYYWDIRTR